MNTETRALKVLHLGPGMYWPRDRNHVTYSIWQALSSGFNAYHVIARSRGQAADWIDDNLRITLIRSWFDREVEFLATQFLSVRVGTSARPSVIVCQSPVLGGLAAIMIARRTGAKILMELHGAEFFSSAPFASRLWILQALSRFALRRADRIRVQTARMAEQLALTYGRELSDRVRILPPRVDLSRFRVKENVSRPGDPMRIAMVGAINPNKGQLRFLRAVRDIAFPAELHAIGSGSDLGELRRKGEQLRRDGAMLRLIAPGAVNHDEVAQTLGRCDVFVMYSETEATPRAIMEAMAVGLPVITTDVGFCADLVEHGREGFILGANPDEEILTVLEQLRADPNLARRMGAAARERARRDYDSVRLFDQYRRLIEETARQ